MTTARRLAGQGGAPIGAILMGLFARLERSVGSWSRTSTKLGERNRQLEEAQADLRSRLAQLEEARTQLDVADRLVAAARLARGLTHEINNPLAVLLAGVEYAAEELAARAGRAHPRTPGERPDEVLTALDEARQAGRRITHLVRQLDCFSKDGLQATRASTDLALVLGHALRQLPARPRSRTTIRSDLAPGPVLVQGDQGRLIQAFLALLQGAALAAERGDQAGRITLTMWRTPEGAVVEVRDDGPPIPAGLLPHLFDPFFTPVAGFAVGDLGLRSAGLGLASCHGAVHAAGGRLEVESAAGQGTVFRAWLPAVSCHSRVALPGHGGGPAARARLMIVEADPFDCACAYRALSGTFDVVPHTTVASALAVLRAGHHFEIICCDPSSGRALAAALAADGSSQAAAVVLVDDDEPPAAVVTAALPARLRRPLSLEQVVSWTRQHEAATRSA